MSHPSACAWRQLVLVKRRTNRALGTKSGVSSSGELPKRTSSCGDFERHIGSQTRQGPCAFQSARWNGQCSRGALPRPSSVVRGAAKGPSPASSSRSLINAHAWNGMCSSSGWRTIISLPIARGDREGSDVREETLRVGCTAWPAPSAGIEGALGERRCRVRGVPICSVPSLILPSRTSTLAVKFVKTRSRTGCEHANERSE